MCSGILAFYSFIHELLLKGSLCQALNTKQSASTKLLCNKRDRELTDINNAMLKMLLCHKGQQFVVVSSRGAFQSSVKDIIIHLALEMVLAPVNHNSSV